MPFAWGSKGVYPPMDSTLVAKLQIFDDVIGRVLINKGSEISILFRGMTRRIGVLGKVINRRATI